MTRGGSRRCWDHSARLYDLEINLFNKAAYELAT